MHKKMTYVSGNSQGPNQSVYHFNQTFSVNLYISKGPCLVILDCEDAQANQSFSFEGSL